MNKTKQKIAVKWEVKVEGNQRSIQLFDKNGNKLDGKGSLWEGYFSCDNNQLTSLEGAKTPEPKKAAKKIFAFFLKKKYVFADGILTKLISKKKTGNITVYKTSKLAGDGEIVYVIKKGDIFSHGKTVKEAKNSLVYKITDRDTSEFKSWKLSDIKTLPQLIKAYRVITGACEFGVRDFVESAKLPKKMSVAKAIELTKDKYNNQKFKEFFTT